MSRGSQGHWQIELHDRDGNLITRKEGTMDPFQTLITLNPADVKVSHLRGAAKVSAIYGTQYNFGEHKVSINITVACDQTNEAIEKAADLIFVKAVDLTEKGMQLVIDATAKAAEKG